MILNNLIRYAAIRALLAAAMAPSVAMAQSNDAAVPQLTAHGRGEVDVTPDRCELVWQVVTRAATAGRASEMNAVAVRAVLDTLRRGFGLTDRDLSTAGYSLQPQMTYPPDGKPPQLVGYVATNSVRVRTSLLDRVGALLDAAVAKGATNVSGLTFYAANPGEPRRRALAIAVEGAKQDAEAMAMAAGGRLGQLIEITTEYPADPRPISRLRMTEMSMARVAETPIQAADVTVTATVTAKWRFVPGGG